MIGKRILRKREVLERLGIRKTTLHESFIKTGRLRLVKIGARAVGIIEDELDALIEELRCERDRRPPAAGAHRAANADDAARARGGGLSSAGTKSCNHGYCLRYLQPFVYRAPLYGQILQRALSAKGAPPGHAIASRLRATAP
jgi:predicted DNA-binding transcriptional regulator AlpA